VSIHCSSFILNIDDFMTQQLEMKSWEIFHFFQVDLLFRVFGLRVTFYRLDTFWIHLVTIDCHDCACSLVYHHSC
jgi:hypothetical protein